MKSILASDKQQLLRELDCQIADCGVVREAALKDGKERRVREFDRIALGLIKLQEEVRGFQEVPG